MSELLARGNRGLFLLLLLTLLLTALQFGFTPLFEPDEGRYAEISREMLASGDFVTPRLNGVLYLEKPPLFYWLVAGSMSLFGPNEWAIRLPGMLATIGMVAMTVVFARRRWGTRTALLAGLVTGSSVLVFVLARIAIIDPVLSLSLSSAAFAFAAFLEADHDGHRQRARWALYALHVACAAALMLKGLIGIVLPGGAIAVYIVLSGRWRLVPRLFSPGPLLVFLVLAVPWHVEVARRNPDFLQFYFVHEHFDRFVRSGHRREGSPLYYVAVLLVGFLPWTGFLGRLRETFPASLSAFRDRRVESFLWTFSILVFLFFSVSRSKLIPYIEPIWPLLGLLLAIGIERTRQRGTLFTPERFLTAFFLGALLVAGAAWGIGAGYLHQWGAERLGIAALAALAVAGFLSLAPRAAARFSRSAAAGPSRLDPVPWVAGPWVVFLLSLLLILPSAARQITPWPLVSVLLRELRPGDVLVQRGHYLQSAPFYTKRLTPVAKLGWHELDFGRSHPGAKKLFPSEEEFRADWNGPDRVLAIVQGGSLPDFLDPKMGLRPGRELARTASGKHVLLSNQ